MTTFQRISRIPILSDLLFTGLGFPLPVLHKVQCNPASIGRVEKEAYRYPLRRWRDRAAMLVLAEMVPTDPHHPAVPTLHEADDWAQNEEFPVELVWGTRDPIMGPAIKAIKRRFPHAPVTETHAGHFLQEEVPELLDEAILRMVEHYHEFKKAPQKTADHILSTSQFVEPLRYDNVDSYPKIDDENTFEDRREFGEFLAVRLKSLGMQKYDDDGLWTWLGLVYLKQILYGPGCAGEVKATERWIFRPDNRLDEHRHLVRGPVYICEVYADDDDVKQLLLAGNALTTVGSAYNEICARKMILRTPSIMRAMPHLYLANGKVKPKVSNGKDFPGTVERMGKYIKQLSRTFYLDNLTTEQFLDMLPAEYDRWKTQDHDYLVHEDFMSSENVG